MSAAEKLKTALRDAMSASCGGMSEREALEAAGEVADEWSVRLDEVVEEEEDDESDDDESDDESEG
jgi:hypothetical protein